LPANTALLKTRFIFLFLPFLLVLHSIHAQEVSFKDSLAAYNLHRINITKTGMKVLGSWGLVNIAGGAAGYFAAKQDEVKYFSEMNVLWGAVNTGIAAISLSGVRREMAAKMNYEQSYNRYLANKRIYLFNAGLDIFYIGAGVGLTAYGQNDKKDQPVLYGYGKSIVVQGIFLLLFDNIMFSANQLDNSKWFRLMNEVRFTKNSIGFNYHF
jgi:hypothetical protein